MKKKKDYDKALFRLIKILNLIQQKGKADTAGLAVEFNISRRTAQRDIVRLMSAGFQIVEDEQQKGTYRFFEGYSLKGLPVSNAEMSLLISLCEVSRHMGGEFSQAYKNIFAKVMNTGEWDSPFFVMMPKAAKPMANEGLMKTAQEAIEASKRVRILYERAPGQKKELVLEPLKLIFHDAYWYLLLRIPGKSWIIKYRLDRTRAIEMVEERFKPPKHLLKMLRETHSIWFNEKRDKLVRIRAAAEVAQCFKDRSYFPLQKIAKTNKDGSIEIQTKLCHYMEAIPTIYRWIPYLTVLSPKDLAQEIRKSVASYLKTL